MSISNILSSPRNRPPFKQNARSREDSITISSVPKYGERNGFVPRNLVDFGDGGAFPEIHIAQFPNNMGRVDKRKQEGVIPLCANNKGDVDYGSLARIGKDKNQIIYYGREYMDPLGHVKEHPKPKQEEIDKLTLETRLELERVINRKIQGLKSSESQLSGCSDQFVKYVPLQSTLYGAESNERLVRIVPQQIDPMEPPKFKHKKTPRPPPSPPAPVLHSPPRKATSKEQKAWIIPPSISNWKNPKGYTIPLDKRLASDGRGLQEIVINEKFSHLSEALYIAESHARMEVEERNDFRRRLMEKEREEKEKELRTLAENIRRERFKEMKVKNDFDSSVEERELVRKLKSKERERELRLSKIDARDSGFSAKSILERDISEKIALGVSQQTINKETLFDQRLFNTTEGIDSGFTEDDKYDIYDRPLFSGSSANVLYNSSNKRLREDEPETQDNPRIYSKEDTNRSYNDLRTTGKPIEFEKGPTIEGCMHGNNVTSNHEEVTDTPRTSTKTSFDGENNQDTDDPFGINKFLQEAREYKKS